MTNIKTYQLSDMKSQNEILRDIDGAIELIRKDQGVSTNLYNDTLSQARGLFVLGMGNELTHGEENYAVGNLFGQPIAKRDGLIDTSYLITPSEDDFIPLFKRLGVDQEDGCELAGLGIRNYCDQGFDSLYLAPVLDSYFGQNEPFTSQGRPIHVAMWHTKAPLDDEAHLDEQRYLASFCTLSRGELEDSHKEIIKDISEGLGYRLQQIFQEVSNK